MGWSRIEHDNNGLNFVTIDEAESKLQALATQHAQDVEHLTALKALASPSWFATMMPEWFLPALLGLAVVGGLFGLLMLIAMWLRVVVSTNEVHIVQSAKRTVSYGKDQTAGNTYYQWPPWIPRIGVRVIILPVSVFNVDLNDYAAYDIGRVPFAIDIMAFFRIEDSNQAAQRVHSFEELRTQLRGILQGAVRSILASNEIEEILQGRQKFGDEFTVAVDAQLKAWGVVNVKNIELMDIRDAEGSKVISNIMEKKKSLIEKQSRVAVAENRRAAEVAEIEARQAVGVRQQEADQLVGQRTAEKDQAIGIARQIAEQRIKNEERVTAEKEMLIVQVNEVRKAEITKAAQIIEAEQQRQRTIVIAEGDLEQARFHAQGVELEGRAKGEAEKAVLMAPVAASIALAEKIAELPEYQKYLIAIRELEKGETVGVTQAVALQKADIKVIANSGAVVNGVDGVMDLFSTKGGTNIGGMIEAIAQTPMGKALVKKVLGGDVAV